MTLARSSAYRPTSDGQSEDMLWPFVSSTQDDWDERLDAAELAVNNAWQESVKNTPFMQNPGQHPLTPASLDVDHIVPASKAFAEDMQAYVEEAKKAWASSQQRQSQYANQRQREVNIRLVCKIVNPVAYQPSKLRIHDVFHVSLLHLHKLDGTI